MPDMPFPLRRPRRRGKGRPFTCADLDYHLEGKCGLVKGVKAGETWEGMVYTCPRCGEVFMAEDADCLTWNHAHCKRRMRA